MQIPGSRGRAVNILVDCGKAQGKDPELPFGAFPVAPEHIQYLFLTHAHIDHIGRVPDLIEAGFDGEIICTHGTKALLIPMLRDSLSFTQKSKREIQAIEQRIDDLSWGFEYGEVFFSKKVFSSNWVMLAISLGPVLSGLKFLWNTKKMPIGFFFREILAAQIPRFCLILIFPMPVIC